MNNVNLIGRLTRDPDLRHLQSGQAVARFTLAVDKQLTKDKRQEMEARNQPTADFINIVAWGKQAEFASKFLKKGLLTGVTGSINTGSYEKDGVRVYTTDINAREITMIEWPDNNNGFDDFEFTPTTDDRVPF